MSRRKTHEEFIEEMKQNNSHYNDIEIIGQYKNKKTRIECRCKNCNKTWFPTPDSLVRKGYGCPDCRYGIIAKKNLKSHSTFIAQMKQVNPNITILEKYVDDKTYLKCKCNECGHIWKSPPSRLLRGKGCPNYRDHNGFVYPNTKDYTGNKFGMLTVLERIKTDKGIVYKCQCDCGNYVYVKSAKLKSKANINCGCNNTESTRGKFIDITGNVYGKLAVLKRMENRVKDLYWLCRCECGNEVVVRGSYLKKGLTKSCGCIKSHGEYNVDIFLNNNKIEYISQMSFNNLIGLGSKSLTYDFYLPNQKVLIECQGEQHYHALNFFGGEEKFQIQQEHDKRKREYAKANGYRLIEIFYKDYDKIEEILSKELNIKELEVG